MATLRFTRDWHEDVTLPDGTRLRLRLITPADKDKIARGMEQMSPHSRYLRFFTDKPRLTEAELRYLTEIDDIDHFAIAAGLLTDDGQEGDGVGVARFVRAPDDRDVAEPAVAVVDAMQGRGIGRLLMSRLIAAAVERDVKRFRTDLLAVNRPMRQLVSDLSPHVNFHADGPVVTAEFALPSAERDEPIEASPQYQPLYRMLRMMAEQVVQLRKKIAERFEHLELPRSLVRLGQAVGIASVDDEQH